MDYIEYYLRQFAIKCLSLLPVLKSLYKFLTLCLCSLFE